MYSSRRLYFLWRLLYIGLKPGTVFFSAKFLSSDVANTVSFAIVVSSTLMASLSFGTYRLTFKNNDSEKTAYYENFRRGVFLFNLGLLIIISVLVLVFGDYSLDVVIFLLLFVVSEHVVHDESRVFLYQGNREKWARHNFLRSSFIALLPIGFWLFPSLGLGYLMAILFAGTIFTSLLFNGLSRVSFEIIKLPLSRTFYRRYLKQSNYFVSSFISKFNQQSDRYLFAFMSYDTLWIYTLIAQIGSVSLMFFEMTYMSSFKAKIVEERNYHFQFLSFAQLKAMFSAIFISLIVYLIASMQLSELLEYNYLACFLIFVIVNMFAATNMLNSEKLFWYLNKPSKFTRVELGSFLFGHLLVVPLVLLSSAIVLVRIPTLFAYIFKIWSVRKCLKA